MEIWGATDARIDLREPRMHGLFWGSHGWARNIGGHGGPGRYES